MKILSIASVSLRGFQTYAFAASLIVAIGCGREQQRQIAPKKLETNAANVKKISAPRHDILYLYFKKLGHTNNCYFTIESPAPYHAASCGVSNLQALDLLERPKFQSVDDLVFELKRIFKKSSFQKNVKIGNIIHVFYSEEKALKMPSLLDKEIDYTYAGEIWKLPEQLGNQFGQLCGLHAERYAFHIFSLDTQDISFSATNATIRDILTVYLPLEKHEHLLWFAEVDSAKNKIAVQFRPAPGSLNK